MPSLSTISGFIAGIALFASAISQATEDYIIFVSVPSLMFVVGGTISAAFLSYEWRDIFGSFISMFGLFRKVKNEKTFKKDVQMLLELAKVQRTQGKIAIEQSLTKRQKKDPFISFAVDLLLSNYKSIELRTMLNDMVLAEFEKGNVRAQVLRAMGGYAPAFGMIGTIIGLVIILNSFGGDVAQLGSGLSIALITTLYGVLLANFSFFPAAEKIARNTDIQNYRQTLMLEGFVLIAEKKGTLAIQDKLNSLLTPELRYKTNT